MIELNPQQESAANFTAGVAGVVAVPGSGKTLTMTRRIGNLVLKQRVAPQSILGLTFTRNAAQAMRDKLKPVLKGMASKVYLSTMHSFCFKLLREEGRRFDILQGKEELRFIRKIMSNLCLKHLSAGNVLGEISMAKCNMITTAEFKAMYEGDDLLMNIGEIYEVYEKEKEKNMLLDFNDLLLEAHGLLQTEKEVRGKYRQMYRHVLVDEYQDVNPAQMAFLMVLIGDINGDASFWVCGDDSQAIYAFAGASVGNILNFKEMFPESRQFILETNYRSTPQILRVCRNLIRHNTKRIDKELRTDNPDGDEVIFLKAKDEEDEAKLIVNEVKDLSERKGYSLRDMAVLYRANSQSRVIEETFSHHGIPYRIENGLNFYQRFEVRTLLDFMRLIVSPDSDDGDEALKNVINIPNRYIGKKFMSELEMFSDEKNIHLYEALKIMPVGVPYLRNNIRDFVKIIQPLTESAVNTEPADLTHMLRESLDYDSFIADEAVPSPDDVKIANINQLQMAALRFKNIPSFLKYTETFRDETGKDRDGVSLMTIHKSKGLEFPVVFVIGFTEGVLPNKSCDIEEERRIAFVGMSRAMKHLYVSYSENCMGKPVKPSEFLKEMVTEE